MNKGPIPLTPVTSSQLAAIGHDPATNTLAIRFNGKDGRIGSLYHYANVTAEQFEAFQAAESKGSHFIRNIKPATDKHPYTRIVEKQEDAGTNEA